LERARQKGGRQVVPVDVASRESIGRAPDLPEARRRALMIPPDRY
jgi:hypothetical protein